MYWDFYLLNNICLVEDKKKKINKKINLTLNILPTNNNITKKRI